MISPRILMVGVAVGSLVAGALAASPMSMTVSPRQETRDVPALLRGRIEVIRAGQQATAGGDRLLARMALPTFYEARAFSPVWIEHRRSDALLDGLESAIRRAAEHGLDPADYHQAALRLLRARIADHAPLPQDLADLEILASDAFMVLGSHLLLGRVNPETLDPEWLSNRRSASFGSVLAEAIDEASIEERLFDLAPAQRRYAAIVATTERLRGIARSGGWPRVAAGPRLELGVENERVSALRVRLGGTSELPRGAAPDNRFDQALTDAVRRFQVRHGLEPDGIVGPATLEALNVTAADRVRQLEANLERWRWLPADLGDRHIEVNIAGFDAKVVEEGRTVRTHRAVVGRQYRQTPMFSGVMTYLVLSPYWHVPPTIAAVDKLPLIKADRGTLAAQRMVLLDQHDNRPVEVESVEWETITGPEFNRRYRLRQDPGPANALGAVKFMFPNRHNVYLHDTPSRELFDRTSRSFSSGCIRIDDPLGLAEYLLEDQPEWTRARIDRTATGGTERTVRLARPLPVHLLYWTAWADADGTVHFRDDIYGRDRAVHGALDAPPPGAE